MKRENPDPFDSEFFNFHDRRSKGIWRVHDFVFNTLFTKIGAAVVIVLFLALGFGGCMLYKSSEKMVTFTVEDKERVTECDGNGSCSSYYLVFTNNGVYKNEDDMAYGKFRSSDLQGRLKEGQTFHCKVAGWRVGLFSMYPNIINCEEAGSIS